MTPTLDATEAAFLAAVIADPADDTTRLVYADWLEEHGQEERAEFIRVQCELADRMPPADAVILLYNGEPTPNAPKTLGEKLRRRERQLWTGCDVPCLESLPDEWVPTLEGGVASSQGAHAFYRRGFVAEVRCSLIDWCGEECPGCPDRAGWQHRPYPGGWDRCEDCRGTGRVGGHGPALVRAAPLERVTLTDRPITTDYGRSSIRADGLPKDLIPFLNQQIRADVTACALGDVALFVSERAALDALSSALLAWAKGVTRK